MEQNKIQLAKSYFNVAVALTEWGDIKNYQRRSEKIARAEKEILAYFNLHNTLDGLVIKGISGNKNYKTKRILELILSRGEEEAIRTCLEEASRKNK